MKRKYLNLIPVVVLLLSGIFSVRAQTYPTPGGINMSGYNLNIWVDGNHSSNTFWPNLSPNADNILGKGSTYAPIVKNSRFNYNKELDFSNATSSKLFSANPYTFVAGNSYYVFTVSDATTQGTATNGTLLTFGYSATTLSLRWNTSATNIFSVYWNATARNMNLAAPPYPRYGIISLNFSNNTTSNPPLSTYFNGMVSNFSSITYPATTSRNIIIGNASTSQATGSASPFNGTVQEIIIINSNSSQQMRDIDVAKIHSYLAVKYGITLINSSYYDSDYNGYDEGKIWDVGQTGFNNNIFGIGRDDASGLYQKQSHSVSNPAFIAYVGNLSTLNSENTGTLENKQFLMFGADNSPSIWALPDDAIESNVTYYEGGKVIESTTGFNIQSRTYLAQLTQPDPLQNTPMNVNLVAPSSDFSYVLVSKSDGFPEGLDGTRLYKVDEQTRVANVSIDNEYKYIKFVGFAPGPGGISVGLRLWLRADDETSIDLTPMSGTQPTQIPTANLTGYDYKKYNPTDDPDALPAVSAWHDYVRDQHYSYSAGETTGGHLYPVLQRNSTEMNYYPAVRFWGNGTSTGAFLANLSGVIPSSGVSQPDHTAIIMVNNNFNTNNWIYPMMFGSATGTNIYSGPGYGIQKVSGNLAGRLRLSGYVWSGTRNLFTPGATSILSYFVNGSNKNVLFRFNGVQDMASTTGTFWGTSANMANPSQLGKGYTYDRTVDGVMSEVMIYDRILTSDEIQKVESYLAIKYGVTLRPENTGTQRFSYKFSDGSPIWDGDVPSGKFVDFYHNVAAIIRDDDSRLNNTHAHSTDAESLLHVGVAGTALSEDGSGVGSLDNLEAVAFGSNDDYGFTNIDYKECGGFTERFNRIWLLHKITDNNRPISLIVGAQNNMGTTLGQDNSNTTDYYYRLTTNYDVSMIVGASPADISAGRYIAVVPMAFVNGEFQCTYEFTDEDTYITFGCIESQTGCVNDRNDLFPGIKTFTWESAWARNTNPATTIGLAQIPAIPTSTDLGNNVLVKTQVEIPAGVRTNSGYPRPVNINSPSMGKGSLQVQRRNRFNTTLTTTIAFKHADDTNIPYSVIPYFGISSIDRTGNSFEEVEIVGRCNGIEYSPRLSYVVADPTKCSYQIFGNRATAVRGGGMSATNKNGMIDVAFRGGVDTVQIMYRISGATSTSTRTINISPINFNCVLPPPAVNEAGLAFSKRANSYNISNCETEAVKFTFEIRNVNCESKVIRNFTDSLPLHMTWDIGSIAIIDTVSSLQNPDFNPQILGSRGEKLYMDSLVIPGARTLIMEGTALFDDQATTGEYANQAEFIYTLLKDAGNGPVESTLSLKSTDAFFAVNGEQQTIIDFTHRDPAQVMTVTDSYSQDKYRAGDSIRVNYVINNPNAFPIDSVFLDVSFNPEFTYRDNSLQTSLDPPYVINAGSPGDGMLSIYGSSDVNGEYGLTLPPGLTSFSFVLDAPINKDNLAYVIYAATGKKVSVENLVITYSFTSYDEDSCILTAMPDDGIKEIPYSAGKLVTNKNVTNRTK